LDHLSNSSGDGGMVKPCTFAARKFTTSSNFVGRSTGDRIPGLVAREDADNHCLLG